jgi:hypothetical protein
MGAYQADIEGNPEGTSEKIMISGSYGADNVYTLSAMG